MTTNSSPPPRPGDVIEYSYLWRHETAAGQEEGIKSRPCLVLALEQQAERWFVYVVPATSTRPRKGGIELPGATANRIGLRTIPCWIVALETNRFAWPGPNLRPVPGTRRDPFWMSGAVSGSFHAFVAAAHLKWRQIDRGAVVSRSE